MREKKPHDDTLEELIRVSREISSLLEDNAQNIKDCHRTLKKIESVVCPRKENPILGLIRKMLNKSKRF